MNFIFNKKISFIIIDGTWDTLSVVNEQDDQIEIDGEIFHKPFVEKPVSAENHDVYIYFPLSAGGGSQRLFRKVLELINLSNNKIYYCQFGEFRIQFILRR